MIFKIIISILFISLLFVRLFVPQIKIDSLSVILLVLAIVPWFIQYIKSLEIKGFGKVELFDKYQKKSIEQSVEEIGITSKPNSKITNAYLFYELRYQDPKLAMAGLRIELESTLSKLITQKGVQDNSRYSSIQRKSEILLKNKIISPKEYALIRDIVGILNKAVHGQIDKYYSTDFDWVFDIGLSLLDTLNEKLKI